MMCMCMLNRIEEPSWEWIEKGAHLLRKAPFYISMVNRDSYRKVRYDQLFQFWFVNISR
jgi:hypothetical protein